MAGLAGSDDDGGADAVFAAALPFHFGAEAGGLDAATGFGGRAGPFFPATPELTAGFGAALGLVIVATAAAGPRED